MKPIWSHMVRKLDGYAFVSRADGRILDANKPGWGFLQQWRRDGCGWELGSWLLTRVASRKAGQPEDHELRVALPGGRRFRLTATTLPEHDQESHEPLFIVHADELLGRLQIALSRLRAHYSLTHQEAETLSLLLNGYGKREMAEALDLDSGEVKRLVRRVRAKLGGARDDEVAEVTEPTDALSLA